jgi:hypothetical protein
MKSIIRTPSPEFDHRCRLIAEEEHESQRLRDNLRPEHCKEKGGPKAAFFRMFVS